MFEVKNNIFEMEIMMSVRIIIDSASDLTKEQADKLGLDFLPLKTILLTLEPTHLHRARPTSTP